MSVEAGVYTEGPDGSALCLHRYHETDYHLADVAEFFALGRAEEDGDGRYLLILTKAELRQLRSLADAHSFDHEEGLIELCHALSRHGAGSPEAQHRFWSED